MSTALVVEEGPFRWRLGLVADGRLVELRIVDVVAGIEDDIFLARVTAAAPSLGGVFADLGRGAAAFVRLPRRLRHPPPTVGTALVVQGVRDPRPEKAARASPTIRLAGAFMELRPALATPDAEETLPSAERQRLSARAKALLPAAPVVLGAAAAAADDAALIADHAGLAKLWAEVERRSVAARAPSPLFDEDDRLRLVLRALVGQAARVHTDPLAALRVCRLLQPLGHDADVVASDDPWAEVGAAGAIDAAHVPRLPLEGGGTLMIEHTQALVAVDIDRGAATGPVSGINRTAVRVLAEAIRVRGLGGQLVVDFLEPETAADRDELGASLRRMLAPLDVQLLVLLAGGLAVLERPQRRIALADRLDPALDALEDLLRRAAARGRLRARVACDVDDRFGQGPYGGAARRWLARKGSVLRLERDPALPLTSFVVAEETR